MNVSRLPDWSWRLESPWVTMASDHKAGPNPGHKALLEADADPDAEVAAAPATSLV